MKSISTRIINTRDDLILDTRKRMFLGVNSILREPGGTPRIYSMPTKLTNEKKEKKLAK